MSETPMTLPLSVVVELNDLRTRLAGMANPPREVFLALYDGAEPELFTTVEAARAYCDDLAPVDAYGKGWDWLVNEHGIHVQFWTHPDDDRPLSETSGSVTAVVVQGPEPVASVRVGDRVEVTAAQSYEITWDEDGDRIVGEFGTVLEVSVRAVEDNAASGTRDATPYRVRLDGGEAVWAADVRPEAEGLRRRIAEGEEYGERLRARVAELKAAPRMAFRASHDSIVMGHYSNREAARKHCETLLRRELGDEEWTGWVPDDGSEDAPEELCFSEEVLCSGYVVTALTVASAFDEEADE